MKSFDYLLLAIPPRIQHVYGPVHIGIRTSYRSNFYFVYFLDSNLLHYDAKSGVFVDPSNNHRLKQ